MMPDILGTNGKDHILGNIAREIADPLQAAADEDEIQIGRQIVGIILHPIDQGFGQLRVHTIQFFITLLHFERELGILFGKGPDGVVKHAVSLFNNLVQEMDFGD